MAIKPGRDPSLPLKGGVPALVKEEKKHPGGLGMVPICGLAEAGGR